MIESMSRAFILIFMLVWSQAAFAQSCPEPLASARRLVLVTAPNMTTSAARLERFERAGPTQPWRSVGEPQSALVGKSGMAWAFAFRTFAKKAEPIKIDGDKRAPMGFFSVGQSFGFALSSRPGYLQIKEGTVCVDTPASGAYNTITTRAKVGTQTHGENMWRVAAYRNGIVIDYPTDRRARAGSCIFIHVRLQSATGTAGCVAVAEPQVIELQDFTEGGAVLGIMPTFALDRFPGCLSGVN